MVSMDEIERVEVPPDKSLMPKLGLGGYSIPQAIAELVDNSIDARIEGRKLHVKIRVDGSSISVQDDGAGMDAEALTNALRLAHSQKKGKLGEFGLGLKAACTSLGKRFDVKSSPEGDASLYHIWYDEDEWGRSPDQWILPLVRASKGDPRQHGTEVTVKRLGVKTRGLVTRLRKDLSRRFQPYIASGQVEIKVNRKRCRPEKVALIEGSRKNFTVFVRGNRIHGWYGLLRHGSQRGFYGFHTYRRGRLITTYHKIGIQEHPTMARIVGEIHLDHVPVTHNKREFIEESKEFQEAAEALNEQFKDLVRQARQAAVPDKITKRVREELDAWKDWLQEALKMPELAGYSLPVGVAHERVDPSEIPDSSVHDVDVELRSPPKELSEPSLQDERERERIPKKTHPEKRNTIRIKGRRFEYVHDFRPLGLDAPWKEYSVDENRRLIEIFTNTDFPSYYTTKDPVFYAVIHIAESLAEILVTTSGESKEKTDEIRECILRASSMIANQVGAA